MNSFSRTVAYLAFILLFVFLTFSAVASYFVLNMQITTKLILIALTTGVGIIVSRPKNGLRIKLTEEYYINL